MIERVARKLCESLGDEPDCTEERALKSGIWTDAGQPHWTGYIELASEAMNAIGMPTEEDLKGTFRIAAFGHFRPGLRAEYRPSDSEFVKFADDLFRTMQLKGYIYIADGEPKA